MAITPDNYWPLASTIQQWIPFFTPATYENSGILSVNPIDGHMVMIYRSGNSFQSQNDNGIICIRHSPDGGATWTIEATLFSDTGYDLRNIAGGYDSNGNLFVFYTKCLCNGLSLQYVSLNYSRSNNNGYPNSWIAVQSLSVQTNITFNAYGHIVDDGTNLYQTWYGDDGNGNYVLSIYESTDNGLTFSLTSQNIFQGTAYLSEPSMVNLGGGCFIVLATENSSGHFHQFMKNDGDFNTAWQDQGDMDFGVGIRSQPWLSFINFQGVGIVVCYFTLLASGNIFELDAVYGPAEDLLTANTNQCCWLTTNSISVHYYPIYGGNSGSHSFFHPFNQFKGIGLCFQENSNGGCSPIITFTNVDNFINDILINLNL